MTHVFEPYSDWLGIAPSEQPANCYRLLGLQLFEPRPEVITQAANERLAYLQQFLTSERAAEAQRLMNEVAGAAQYLLDPTTRSAYDVQLQAQLAYRQSAAQAAVVPAELSDPWGPQGRDLPASAQVVEELKSERRKKRNAILYPLLMAAALLAGVGTAVTLVVIWFHDFAAAISNAWQQESPLPEQADSNSSQPTNNQFAGSNETPPASEPAPMASESTAVPQPIPDNSSSAPAPSPAPPSPTAPSPTASVPPASEPVRTAWAYERGPEGFSGTIQEVVARRWREDRSDGARFQFVERSRDAEKVVLFDQSRDLIVHLYNDRLEFKRGANAWVRAQSGGWK